MPTSDTYERLFVGATKAIFLAGSPERQVKIANGGEKKVFYKNASDVDTGDTEIAAGASATLEESVWVISESTGAHITVSHPEGQTVQDLTVADDLTISGSLTVTEGVTATGTSTIAGTVPGVYAWAPPTAESGTDTKGVEKKLFVVSAFLPVNKELTGVAILVGATSKGKVVAGLFNSAGEVLAKSSETTEGTALGTAKEIQKLAFTAKYKASGPATYFIGVTHNGVEEGTFRTIPANVASDNVWTAEKTLAEKNKLATFTSPPSTFTADKGPVAMLY